MQPPAGASVAARLAYILHMQQITAIHRATRGEEYYLEYACDADDQRLVYSDIHWLHSENGVDHRLVANACAHGQPFVRTRVDTATAAI
jgi:hypothetical protein